MGLLAFLSSIGWLMNLLGIIEFCLPYVAFFVTDDWEKDFDCFGIVPLALDIVISFLKALLYILIGGLSQKTCLVVIEAVVCNGMAGCITGGVLLGFYTYKRHHGRLPGIMMSIGLSVVFIFAVALFMMGLQMKWKVEEAPPQILMGAMIAMQVLQSLYPMYKRLMNPMFSGDESMVVALKCVASVILIFTSSYDAWSLGKSLRPLVTEHSASWHLAMCLSGAATGVVQLIMRLISMPFEGLLVLYQFWSNVFQKLEAVVFAPK